MTRAPPGGVLDGQLGRVGDGGEVALRGAAPLDLGDDADIRARGARPGRRGRGGRPRRGLQSASGSWASRTARSSRTPATISSSTFMSGRPRAPLPVARPSPRQPDGWTHSRGGRGAPLPGGGSSGPDGFRYGRSPVGAGSAVGSSPRSSAFQAAWARSSSVSGRGRGGRGRGWRRPVRSAVPWPARCGRGGRRAGPRRCRAVPRGRRAPARRRRRRRSPCRPRGRRRAAAAWSPPVKARTPDHTSTPPAAAISSPTTARPHPRTASRARPAASSTSPAAGTSGAAVRAGERRR